MIRKFKIYLDTSAISYLRQDDSPEKMQETLEFWEDVKEGIYDVFISAAVIREINKCKTDKRDLLMELLSEVEITQITATQEIETLAQKIIECGILPKRSHMDSMHIACAVVADCDYIASWNMKHMANIRTNRSVRILTLEGGYKEINIVTPAMFKKGEHLL